jgi:hypothetical protein
MLNTRLSTLYCEITARMRRITIFLLGIVLVAGLSMAGLSIRRALIDQNNRSVAQRTDPGLITGVVAKSPTAFMPGHDFGAIYGSVDPGKRSPINPPFITYWVAGQIIVRPSEFGPLTYPVSALQPSHWPGHNFGAIDN